MIYFCIVKITIKARKVTVKGPKGEITKDFSHMPIDIRILKLSTKKQNGLYVRLQMWNGGYK
jgi:large subunit ribosomal protein L9e